MAEKPEKQTLTFYGERITWIAPGTLQELLVLKAKYPDAPLVSGNTALGEWSPCAYSIVDAWLNSLAPDPLPICCLEMKYSPD